VATIEERDHEAAEAARARKVIIAGTGRAGTTLLVQVLTDLGLDTGFPPDAPIDDRAAAGLELPAAAPNSPRIVKSPHLSRWLAGLLDDGRIEVEHVIIPIRDLDVAAASRVRLARYGADLHTWGGLFGTTRATRQREALAVIEYELLHTIARHDLALTLLEFPRFAQDWEYAYRKLGFLDPTIPADRWRSAVEDRVRPELIHEAPLTDRERWLTRLGTLYHRVIARPIRGVRATVRGLGRRGRPA
jgi:hypothetical protein